MMPSSSTFHIPSKIMKENQQQQKQETKMTRNRMTLIWPLEIIEITETIKYWLLLMFFENC